MKFDGATAFNGVCLWCLLSKKPDVMNKIVLDCFVYPLCVKHGSLFEIGRGDEGIVKVLLAVKCEGDL